MLSLKSVLHIFVYVVVVCPLLEIRCHARGKIAEELYEENGEHTHTTEPPCAVCPRGGVCVPRVQCPAHLRPGSSNPLCHLQGTDTIGVCCFTGHHHAAEADRKLRSSAISVDDVKESHQLSRKKVAEWFRVAEKLYEEYNAIVNVSSPSYGHHLSMVTYDGRVEELGRGAFLNLFATQELKSRQAIDDRELALGLTDHTDGIWAMRTSTSRLPLPSARAVSQRVLAEGSRPSRTLNMMFMQFGQFIAHDVSAGTVFTMGDGKPISCCVGEGRETMPEDRRHWACAPIEIEPNDPFYSHFRQRCMNFVRTQLTAAADCSVGYAKQMNGATHFPDLSHLYGSTADKLDSLKAPGGLLKVFNDYGRDLPPTTDRSECLSVKGAPCFDSGDNHGNQVISLTALHTIWTREHNRVARTLSRLNPNWSEDTVFQETRRILQAEFQNVIYKEWLPLLLGPRIVQLFQLLPATGYSKDYDPRVNPSVTAEFSSAAMRFGHSVVDGKVIIPNPRDGDIYEAISIPEIMFQPSRLRLMHFLDRLIIGVSMQPMQSVDPFVTEGLSRYMFRGGNPYGLDLAAINLQRGRDHGVRSYNHYRRLCGLEPFIDFKQYSPIAAQRLSSVYGTPEDVDLWIGGLLEAPVEGGVVGETFAQILADQFAKLRRGDRYFYEHGPDTNPGAFTPSQLAEIKKVSFARILCDNRDGTEFIVQSPNAFLRSDLAGNEPIPCDSPLIPSMDLSRFGEV
ncbi:unnamed protein product, partial [Iphiclides podalirius]